MSDANCLYITLSYLRSEQGSHKYNWGFFASDNAAGHGTLFHITDSGRKSTDFVYEHRPVHNIEKFGQIIVCLKIADSPGPNLINQCIGNIPLNDPRSLSQTETQVTSRVWLKAALERMHRDQLINLPAHVDTIEQHCQKTADASQSASRVKVVNDLGWMTSGSSQPTIDFKF